MKMKHFDENWVQRKKPENTKTKGADVKRWKYKAIFLIVWKWRAIKEEMEYEMEIAK
jgi:hypothetical protein